MAVVNLLSNAYGFRPNQHSGGSHRIMWGREAASQSFQAGAPLILAAGLLTVAPADAVAGIIGVAVSPATGTTGAKCGYYPATSDMVFEATLEDETNENHALVQANIGADYAIQVDGNGIWYADENDTTNTAVVVVGVLNDSDITLATVRARVLVVFLIDTTIYNT